jgi:hypothetical protein
MQIGFCSPKAGIEGHLTCVLCWLYRKDRTARARAPPLLKQKPQRKRELTWEERFFEEYRPPNLVPNKYVLVAGIIIAISLAVYSTTL